MDNKKIGNLIAELRKAKGLTQQELGDKVGVGFRAVSKWERGLTLPDITIVNEVSKILGISSDELLNGEISKENRKKKIISRNLKIILFSLLAIITVLTSIFIYYNNKTYTYTISSVSEEYYVEGQVVFNKDNISIIVNNLNFLDKELKKTPIKNYEYEILTNGEYIFGYGYMPNGKSIEQENTIKNFVENFRVNYTGRIRNKRKQIIENNIIISIQFTTESNQEIRKEIKIKLTEVEKGK